MAKNEYLAFASSNDANVLTKDEYSNLASRSRGFQSGVANSKHVNTPIRQSSVIASAIAQYIVDLSGQDMIDDGDVKLIVDKLKTSIAKSQDGKYLLLSGGVITGTLNAQTLQEQGKRVYSPNNKPSAVDVGALSITSGGTVTGDTNFTKKLQQNGSDVITKANIGAHIVESYLSSDGLSGYRKWSDQRIEQWGYFKNDKTAQTLITTNLLAKFSNDKYLLLLTVHRNEGAAPLVQKEAGYLAKTESYFTKYTAATWYEIGFSWYASGY